MDNNSSPYKLGSLRSYFSRAFKFYELKNEGLTRFIFVIILFLSFGGAFIPDNKVYLIILNLLSITVIHFASTVYLTAYIKDIKNEEYDKKDCFYLAARNFPKIMLSSLTYLATVIVSLAIIFIPASALDTMLTSFIPGVFLYLIVVLGIFLYLMFIFNICYIVDKGCGLIKAFKMSRKITKGYKRGIFGILFIFNTTLMLPMFIVLSIAASTGNELVTVFVLSFISAIVNLIQQRLIAVMYRDLEYFKEEEIKNV